MGASSLTILPSTMNRGCARSSTSMRDTSVARGASSRHRLREPLPVSAPKAKLRAAVHVLDALGRDRTTAAVPPREARWCVFRAASASGAQRDAILASVAKSIGITPDELDASLFADLRGERRVAELPTKISPSTLAIETNRAIVSSLLKRASHVRISAWGNTRALVRHTRLMGLICVTSAATNEPAHMPSDSVNANPAVGDAKAGVILDISGPFALFRHTEVYGRALASLVPRAAWCNQFEITAACALGRGSAARLSSYVRATRSAPDESSRGTTVGWRSGLRRTSGAPHLNGT